MKKILRNVSYSTVLIALSIGVAVAQVPIIVPVEGLSVPYGLQSLSEPSNPQFTNCGVGCTSYNTGSGALVSGKDYSGSEGRGYTLAMGFKATRTSFKDVLAPNIIYTGNGGPSKGNLVGYLLHGSAKRGPTTSFAKLTYRGRISSKSITLVKWTSKKKLKLKKGATYFFCEATASPHVQDLWMLSNGDFSSPFWDQNNGSCTAKGMKWYNWTGQYVGTAFEVD